MYVFQFYKYNITKALIDNTFCRKALNVLSKPQKIICHIVLKNIQVQKIIRNPPKNPI